MPPPDADRHSRRRHARVLAARFPDAGRARVAIEGLQSAGIDGDDITLLSPFPEKSHRSTHASDARITRYLVRRIVIGFLAGIAAGVLLGGAIVVETLFGLPGVGRLVVTAINQRNYTVVQGSVLVIAALFILVNLATDLLYGVLNPRLGGEAA